MKSEAVLEVLKEQGLESLKDIQSAERLASALEDEKLSETGRKTLHKLKTKIAALEQSLQPLINDLGFSPESAGEKIIWDLQNAEGGAWTGNELAKKFGLTSATLHRRRKEHRIVFWRDAKHDFHYPKWQFTGAGALLPGIEEVLQLFQSQDEWRLMRYFLGRRQQLGNLRPLDLLREGRIDKVLAHAQIHGEENTW